MGKEHNGSVWFQKERQMELERQKFESDLILKVIETNDPDKAAENLQFLLNSGLVSDRRGSLREYLNERKAHGGINLPAKSKL
jgi:hypothetical protein